VRSSYEGAGIEKMADLKGKRVSTGSPGSATEGMAFRVIEAAGLDKGSRAQKREKVGTLSRADVKRIAELKMKDLNANDVDAAILMIEGTTRSMGIEVV